MPKKNFETVGVLQRFTYVKGVIKERVLQGDSEHAESEWDTCTVEIKGHEHAGVPIFYNCDRKEGDPEIEILDNGSLKNAASAFPVDDEVVVLQDLKDNMYVVISHVGEKRKCHTIWELWGGELTKNHNWLIADQYSAGALLNPYSLTADPIYNFSYDLSLAAGRPILPYTGAQAQLVKWGPMSFIFGNPALDEYYNNLLMTPEDIPFTEIAINNCKCVVDISKLDFTKVGTQASMSISLYFFKDNGYRGVNIFVGTAVVPGIYEYDLSTLWPSDSSPMSGVSIEYRIAAPFNSIPYHLALDFALNSIDFLPV